VPDSGGWRAKISAAALKVSLNFFERTPSRNSFIPFDNLQEHVLHLLFFVYIPEYLRNKATLRLSI
jgi:hypothetical protein